MIEEIENGEIKGEAGWDQHAEEKQRKAQQRPADRGIVLFDDQLGESPCTEQRDDQSDGIPVDDESGAAEEDGEAGPPREIEEESEIAHE